MSCIYERYGLMDAMVLLHAMACWVRWLSGCIACWTYGLVDALMLPCWMIWPCACYVLAMCLLRASYVLAVCLLCAYYVLAMFLLCDCYVLPMCLLYACYVLAICACGCVKLPTRPTRLEGDLVEINMGFGAKRCKKMQPEASVEIAW